MSKIRLMKLLKGSNRLVWVIAFCAYTLFSDISLNAQTAFERYYDFGFTEECYDVAKSTNGGYVISGQQRQTLGQSQIVILKIDSSGNQQWVKFFGSPAENCGTAICVSHDSGFLVAGYTSTLDYRYFPYLMKLDSNGDTIWTTKALTPIPINNPGDYGNGWCTDVIEARDSSIYVLSQVADYDTTTVYFLTRLDQNGDSIWTKKFRWNYSGPGLYRISEDADGNILLPGRIHYSLQPSFTCGATLIKTDTLGDTLWTKQYPYYTNNSGFNTVAVTHDSGYFLAGTNLWSVGNTDCYLVRTNSVGDTIWTRNVGGPMNDGALGIVTSDYHYFAWGNTFSYGAGSSDMFIMLVDTSGNVVWQRTYGGANFDNGNSALQTNDGGFLICGFETSYGNGNGNIYVVKTDSNGIAPTGILPLAEIQNRFTIYPNPSSGQFNIDYYLKDDAKAHLYNVAGAEVGTYEMSQSLNTITIDEDLSPGIYFCMITVHEEVVGFEKVIIQ